MPIAIVRNPHVRFLASKSYGVEAPILLGSEIAASAPCLAGVLSISFFLLITVWVTPEDRARGVHAPRLFCFNAGFSGCPNGVLSQACRNGSADVHNPAVHVCQECQCHRQFVSAPNV